MKESKIRPKDIQTVSEILPDGSLVELVCEEDKSTKLVVCSASHISVVASIPTRPGEQLVPLRATHGLIRHHVVRLPSAPTDYGTRAQLLSDVSDYIARYVTLTPTFLALASHYVLLTWVYDVFAEVPYLRFKGDFGSGKTRALQVIGAITYKPIFASGASTVSPIFHALDLFRGTLVFDEADFRFSDEKAEVTKIFNAGTTRGFPVLRSAVNDKKGFDPQAFEVYGPKLIGMREVFSDFALESRLFTEVMRGHAASGVPINLPDTQEEDALVLRNKLLMFRLKERAAVALDESVIDTRLSERSNQLLAPLLSMVSDHELREDIKALLREQEDEQAACRSTQVEALVLDAILHLHARRPDEEYLPLASIRQETIRRYSSEFDRPMTSRYLGGIIRNRLRLRSYKQGTYMVEVPSHEALDALLRKYSVSITTADEGSSLARGFH